MKKRIPMLASFLVPLLITLLLCIDHRVFPFGDQCVLQVDMYHQYCPFFAEMMEKLKTGGSLLYSWNIGLGADFWSLYAYYLASPLNWLLLICPKDYVIEFMTILVIFKIALCGLTFGYYLKKHFGVNHFAISIFGTAYALSAFMAAYSWNIMWTDCMVLAPLIIWGLERLIKEGRPLLYYITLALCILSNYYISIMICIFLVFWFFICWQENKGSGIRAWMQFGLYSLLAGGTGAVLIIPEAIILGYSGSQNISFPDTMEWYFNITEELARHAVLTESYMGREHWPNLYCGVFVLILVVLYLLNREIHWKKKASRFFLVLLFVISFANNKLDFIWHGMHFPDSLPGRQTFLYIFLLLVLSYEVFLHLRGSCLWHLAVAGAMNTIFWFAAYKIADPTLVDGNAFLATGIFLFCYLVLLLFYFLGKTKVKLMMLQMAYFVMLTELILNFDATGLKTTGRAAYVKSLSDYEKVLDVAERLSIKDGDLFYRVEELERKTKNDAALSGYRSATQFSSLMNLNVSRFYQNIGMEGGKNFYCVNGATPLFSAMLSLKYVLADNGLEESPIRRAVAGSGETWIYENKYSLPLGFMMPEDVIDAWDIKGAGDIEVQNQLAYLLGAKEPMLTPIESDSYEGESVIEVKEDGYLFATYEKTDIDDLTEETSDGRMRSFTKVSHGYTLDLGYCRAGTKVRIRNGFNRKVEITAYKLNLSAVDEAYAALSRQTMELIEFSDTRVEGVMKVREPGRLIFSIAQEDGWSLFVDGEKQTPKKFGGAFISLYLDQGVHKILLQYETPGIRIGASISAVCVSLFVLLEVFRRKKYKSEIVDMKSK